MRRIFVAVLACAALMAALVGPAQAQEEEVVQADPDFFVDESSLPFEPVAGYEDSERLWGVHQGAGYRIEVPADWNGDLMLWTHGFRGTEARLYFNPEEVPFREWLLANGYAWAASTYSKNDYSVGTAVTDTRKLATVFRNTIDRPDHIYIAGASMGGHVAAASIERHPNYYDGAMPVCGVLGDYELFDFFLDFNIVAQQMGLGESSFPAPANYNTELAPMIKAEFEAFEGGWPLALNERGQAFKQLVELRSGGDRPNFDEAWFFWNSIPNFGSNIPGNFLFDLGSGDGTVGLGTKIAIKNTDVYYETDFIEGESNDIEAELNANVARINPERGARRLTRGTGSPKLRGNITVPVMSLHNLGDLFVPFHNQTVYHDLVASKGRSDLLVQRAIRGSGHCGFTEAEYIEGFSDLVDWVENGVKPAGDAVGDPAVVASPDFGCRFTDQTPGGHIFAAPCPDGS